MARTLDDILRMQIGQICLQNAQLLADLEVAQERVAQLEKEREAGAVKPAKVIDMPKGGK